MNASLSPHSPLRVPAALLCCVVALSLATGAVRAGAQEGQAISIHKGMALQPILEQVAHASGLPCFAEAPGLPHTADRTLETNVPGALEAIAEAFDLHPANEGNRIVFLRRYSDPSERVDLTVPEIRACVSDLYRLASGLPHNPPGTDYDGIANALAASFSRDQMVQLQRQGLPFGSLRPEQASAVLRVSMEHSIDLLVNSLQPVNRLFEVWDTHDLSTLRDSNRGRHWVVWIPNGTDNPGGIAPWPSTPVAGVDPKQPDTTLVLPVRHLPFPEALRQHIELPAGEFSAGELLGKIEKTLGKTLRRPAAADRRKLIFAGQNPGAGTVIEALGDLYGWQFHDAGAHAFVAPAHYTTAADVEDFHRKQLGVIPPALRSLLHRRPPPMIHWMGFQLNLVDKSHSEAEWDRGVKISQLPMELEERLAQAAVLQALSYSDFGVLHQNGELPRWITHPELGALRLKPGGQTVQLPSGRQGVAGTVLEFVVPGANGGLWGVGVKDEALHGK